MGIVNVTPDSFSDGGLFDDTAHAYDHAMRLFDDGADVVDIGGESTRPGSVAVSIDLERRRTVPVIERLVAAGVRAISIDTRHAAIARDALAAGAAWVNDVSGLADPDLAAAAAQADGLIVMHNRLQGFAAVEDDVRYDDVVADVALELSRLVDVAVAGGVLRERVMVDPGLGFGKTVDDNMRLLCGVRAIHAVGPVLIGPSRKRFVGAIAGVPIAADRDAATVGACVVAAGQSCEMVRVHDVRSVRHAFAVMEAADRLSTER